MLHCSEKMIKKKKQERIQKKEQEHKKVLQTNRRYTRSKKKDSDFFLMKNQFHAKCSRNNGEVIPQSWGIRYRAIF